jgi:hypothetical protein
MKRKLRLEVYKPRRRMQVSKEEAVPFLVRTSGRFMNLGGFISFILSGAVMGIKSFFHIKQKVDDTLIKKKYVELRIKK